MNIKKKGIVVSLLLAAAFAAAAQPANSSYTEGAFHEDTWFVGGGLGLNVGFDGEKFQSREESHSGAGAAIDAYAGYWLFENLGFRAGLRGITISDQYTNFGKYKNLYLHGDVLFKSGNGFIPYLHAGYAHINKGSLAGGVGLMFPIHLSQRVAVIPDVSVAALSSRAFNNGTGSVGLSTSATLGVYVSLGAERKHHDPEHWESVETIGGTVWRRKPVSADEEFAMLQSQEETVKARPEKPKKEKPARPQKEKKEKPEREKPATESTVQPVRTETTAVPIQSASGVNNSASNTLMNDFMPPEVGLYYPQGTPASAKKQETGDPIIDPNALGGQTSFKQIPVAPSQGTPVMTVKEESPKTEAAPVQPHLRVVYFDFDLYDISDLASGILDELVAEMKAEPALNVLVVGHTDSRGSEEYNARLSLERAEAVKAYLVEKGISGGRIATQGVGAAQPAADNDNDGGRALNRRAVIINQEK